MKLPRSIIPSIHIDKGRSMNRYLLELLPWKRGPEEEGLLKPWLLPRQHKETSIDIHIPWMKAV